MDLEQRLVHCYGMLTTLRAPLATAVGAEAKRKAYLTVRPHMTMVYALVWRLERERAAEAREKSHSLAQLVATLKPIFEEIGAARQSVKPGCICAHGLQAHGPNGCLVGAPVGGRVSEAPRCSCKWDGLFPIGGA